MPATRVLIIGDTLLNQTIRAEPNVLGHQGVPGSFLNEEILRLRDQPDWSVQGAACIARHWRSTNPNGQVSLITETRTPQFPDELEKFLGSIGDPETSVTNIEERVAPVSIRVLRNIASPRSHGPRPRYRLQLRIDSSSPPPEMTRGLNLGEAIERGFAHMSAGDLCLLRTSSSSFLGGYGDDREAVAKSYTEDILARAQTKKVPVVLDLRPIPRGLEIRSPDTIVCTTIGRIEDAFGSGADQRESIGRAFWRLSPAHALVCFGAHKGVWVAIRGDLRSTATLHRIAVRWPGRSSDESGLVTGGDAFVAALLDALTRGADLITAARDATAALCVAMCLPLGSPVEPEATRRALAQIPEVESETIEDPAGEPVAKLARLHASSNGPSPLWQGLVAPEGGPMRTYFSSLTEVLSAWRPRPGRDLIAIFGESRSGKEYPLKVALRGLGREMLGPINMHQFLSETAGVLSELHSGSKRAEQPLALVIDEVVPEDASRSLLNLTAEKNYRRYGVHDEPILFTENPIILLSSIEPNRLLRDLQGRLAASLSVPPLRARRSEIPYLLPLHLGSTVDSHSRVRITFRLMAALLAHDYQPVANAPSGFGLDQQNFRALTDLLAYVAGRALLRATAGNTLELAACDLPSDLVHLAPLSLSDEQGFIYERPFTSPGAPRSESTF